MNRYEAMLQARRDAATARVQAHYSRAKAAGVKRVSGASGPSGASSRFVKGQFVAVDGEGFSEGPELVFELGKDKGVDAGEYRGQAHHYALLSASDGSELYAPEGRLTTPQCLDFLCDIAIKNRHAIIVCFGGSYDTIQMLGYGIERSEVALLLSDNQWLPNGKKRRPYLDKTFGSYDYRIECRPRKSLTIKRWRKGSNKYDKRNRPTRAVMWDVWGFFQDSFVGVMKKWIPDSPDFLFIRDMKGARNVFDRSEIDTIKEYNQAELRCLVQIMDKLREAISNLGLKVARWDGSGALAAAIYAKHNIKECKNETPQAVFDAARIAYSGGHIESCKVGRHDGTIHHYDISSAYPTYIARLPDLSRGKWSHRVGSAGNRDFGLILVRWEFNHGNPFYPLFYRDDDASIVYPRCGRGWFWAPEYRAALEYALKFGFVKFAVEQAWEFVPYDEHANPFSFVKEYYDRRQQLVDEQNRTGILNGEEKVIKLGLNSLYGKMCQQVGEQYDAETGDVIPPAYFQLEWAGYVTASTRAALMFAAIEHPHAIINFATDGIFSLVPLDLYCPHSKELGAWEYAAHDGITMVKAGFYWLRDGDKDRNYSRGLDKTALPTPERVIDAWRARRTHVVVPIRSLVSLGAAAVSETRWAMRGMFVTGSRREDVTGENVKRHPPARSTSPCPHLRLEPTTPKDAAGVWDGSQVAEAMSLPYAITWIDGSAARQGGLDLQEAERDAELA